MSVAAEAHSSAEAIEGTADSDADSKKRKLDDGLSGSSGDVATDAAVERPFPELTDHEYQLMRRCANQPKSSVNGTHSMKIARPVGTMKGHTAFLTFAVCPL